jgi:hypothetical protein
MTADQMPDRSEAELLASEELDEDDDSRRRSLFGLIPIIVVIVVVIIVLMLLRDCGGGGTTGGEQGGRSIMPVEGYTPVPGVISLWMKKDADVGTALATVNISSSGRIELGNGHYVVEVASGTEDRAVAALKAVPSVVDAGRVYEE